MHSLSDNVCLYLHIIVMLTYVLRSLTQPLVGQSFTYVLILMLLLVYILKIIIQKGKIHIFNKFLSGYIAMGIALFLFSLVRNGIIVSMMGFASLFLNLFVWRYSRLICDKEVNNINIYLKWFLFAMFINALAAIYQYFVDPSVFGLVTNIYGNETIMGANNVTRRVVGFMGSPQSFSATCGVALFITTIIEKKYIRFSLAIIFSVVGFFSGSRAFGVFFILFVFYSSVKMEKNIRIFVMLVTTAGVLLWGNEIFTKILSSDTLSRTLAFDSWAAFKIYFSSFSEFHWYDFLFGKGFGLNGWELKLNNISFDYSSTESSLISIIYQLGIPAATVFVIAYFKIIADRNIALKDKCVLIGVFINLCCTPAFVGFAFSYVAWPIILLININIEKEGLSNEC